MRTSSINTIYIKGVIKSDQHLANSLQRFSNIKGNHEVVFEFVAPKAVVGLDIPGSQSVEKVLETKDYDIFFENIGARKFMAVAKPVSRPAAERLADLVAVKTFGFLP